MTRLIFDIETVGVEYNSLDQVSRDLLLSYAQSPGEEEELKESLGIYPLTGQIVAIGILNPDTDKGAVYYISDSDDKETTKGDIQYKPLAGEKEVIREFWKTAQHYDQFITFNGRMFDGPYMMIRSAVNKIKPTRNLMPNRYYDQHIDLLDRLTFFGAMRKRMTTLDMWCKAFSIKSPKTDDVTGSDVGRLFKEKEFMKLAEYCAGDLWATKDLFFYWDKYINVK